MKDFHYLKSIRVQSLVFAARENKQSAQTLVSGSIGNLSAISNAISKVVPKYIFIHFVYLAHFVTNAGYMFLIQYANYTI